MQSMASRNSLRCPLGRTFSRLALVALLAGATACAKPPETTVGAAVQQGLVAAVVTGYEVAYLELEGPTGATMTETPVLKVMISVTNGGAEPLRFDMGWSTTSSTQAQSPLLFVDAGGPEVQLGPALNVPTLQLNAQQYLGDPITAAQTIAPGATLEDVLLYQLPPEGTTGLVLSLPPSLFGVEARMPAYVRIPYQAPAEVPRVQPVAIGTPWQGAGFTFTITGAEQAYIPLQRRADAGFSTSPLLRLNFEATNNGSTTIEYLPLRANRGIDPPSLIDEAGSPIELASFEDGVSIEGLINDRRQIGPGETLRSFLLFKRPVANTAEMTFVMPGKRLSSTGLIRILVPYTALDVPRPAELDTPQVYQQNADGTRTLVPADQAPPAEAPATP